MRKDMSRLGNKTCQIKTNIIMMVGLDLNYYVVIFFIIEDHLKETRL